MRILCGIGNTDLCSRSGMIVVTGREPLLIGCAETLLEALTMIYMIIDICKRALCVNNREVCLKRVRLS